jgi:hypothetical protein
MTIGWGTEQWGLDPWGGGNPGALPGPILTAIVGGLLDTRGGTVLEIIGMNFFPTFVPQVLIGVGPGYTLIAEGYLFEPRFDIRNKGTRALPGMPPAPVGTYHLRVKTPAGLSGVLENVLTYAVFAEEQKVQKASQAFAIAWNTSRRIRL